MKTFTIAAVCCCGCDQNELHIVDAPTAETAIGQIPNHEQKRIVAVIEGAHTDARSDDQPEVTYATVWGTEYRCPGCERLVSRRGYCHGCKAEGQDWRSAK